MCGGYYEHFKTPKQLSVVNGERLVERTIRLLKENGVQDIVITSNDERFDGLGVERLEHSNSYRYENGKLNGYWLDAFYPHFSPGTQVTYIFGDVYFTENAIQTIVKYDSKVNTLFGSKYEPFAYKVVDYPTFMQGVDDVKKMQDEGKTNRVPIVWELYRYLSGLDVNVHATTPETFVLINDGTDDADSPDKAKLLDKKFSVLKNVFFFNYINDIGGVESFFYYLAKKYKDNDITVYYLDGVRSQIQRLKKYTRVVKYQGGIIRSERAFFNYNIEAFIDKVEAKEICQIIHCDYGETNLKPHTHPKITRYIAVSEQVKKAFELKTGLKAEVCYNPLALDRKQKVLRLISATRLTPEKGKDRMAKFASLLDEAGVKYIWTVFTNDTNAIDNPSICYLKPRNDIINFIANADYLVQLSDTEAYCYSVVEALKVGTPVIVSDRPVFKEIGLNKDNSFILDMDLNNVPVKAIAKGLKPFKYTPPADRWGEILVKGRGTYQEELKTYTTIRILIDNFRDLERDYKPAKGEEYQVTVARANELVNLGYAEIC
jgi:glycosyltransferase involved in cell wall biosynthesis